MDLLEAIKMLLVLRSDRLLVAKHWRVMFTDARVATGLNFFWCDKSHSDSFRFVLRETQHYPETLRRRVSLLP